MTRFLAIFGSLILWAAPALAQIAGGSGGPTTPAASTVESPMEFYDTFTGTVGAFVSGARTPDQISNGNKWIVTGAGVAGAVVGGGSTGLTGSTFPYYAVMPLANAAWEVGGVFECSTLTSCTPTIAVGSNYAGTGFQEMWHPNPNITTGGAVGFTLNYWHNGLATQVPAWQNTQSSNGNLLAVNTPYRIRVIVNAPWADQIIEDMNGKVILTSRAYEPNLVTILSSGTPFMFIETFDANTTFLSAYARPKPQSSLRYNRFLGGIEGTPIGMDAPAAGNFTSVHIGRYGNAPVSNSLFSVVTDGSFSGTDAPTFASNTAAVLNIRALSAGQPASIVFYPKGQTALYAMLSATNTNAFSLIGLGSTPGTLTFPVNGATPYLSTTGLRFNANAQGLFFMSAAPTSGTYNLGDIVKNSAPAVGSPKGWVCTVAGTPGTWVSEGNL